MGLWYQIRTVFTRKKALLGDESDQGETGYTSHEGECQVINIIFSI